MQRHLDYVCFPFVQCSILNESSNRLLQKMQSHTSCTFLVFSIVCFQMWTRIACLRRCIVTLVAFLWLFSTVCFQMSPKTAYLRRCIVTLVAFVWHFPLLVFKWVLKLPVWEYAKLHWLHLFDFSPLCVFKWVLKSPVWEDEYCIITLIAFVWLFSTRCF